MNSISPIPCRPRPVLQRHVVVEQYVSAAQHVLPLVHPERHVVETTPVLGQLEHQAEIVRLLVRRALGEDDPIRIARPVQPMNRKPRTSRRNSASAKMSEVGIVTWSIWRTATPRGR
jgi:hypothetical protein